MDYKNKFLKVFDGFGAKHRRETVFSDFVLMSATSLHNAVCFSQHLEDRYFEIMKKYDKAEMLRHCELLACVVEGLDASMGDFLGEVFMELELGNARAGQFFTPYHLSKLMAALTHGETLKLIDKPFVTLSEPACGSGSMCIAFAETMRENGYNPQQQLWVQCWDIDQLAAEMCYLQLSLLHIPAEIVIGDTLSLEVRSVMRTPAHHLGFWDSKLAVRDQGTNGAMDRVEIVKAPSKVELVIEPVTTKLGQFGFDF